MVGFLSLPDEVIELVGEQVTGSQKEGLRDWCRVTSTCTRLWAMQLPGSASVWSVRLCSDNEGKFKVTFRSRTQCKLRCLYTNSMPFCAGVPWEMQRIQSSRDLTITRWAASSSEVLQLDVLRQTMKAMIRASRSFQNLSTLVDVRLSLLLAFLEDQSCLHLRGLAGEGNSSKYLYIVKGKHCASCISDRLHVQHLGIYDEQIYNEDASTRDEYFQSWMSALLLGATKLTSLSVVADGVPWPPVLGLLSLRHLELIMAFEKPWLNVILADLSLCPCLETLKLVDDAFDEGLLSTSLPDLYLHDVTTLTSLDLIGWYPWDRFTLPPGCLLRLRVVLDSCAEWHHRQRRGCPISMLSLVCMKLQAWPTGIQEMSGLRSLNLHCTRMQDQDLAALQQIPHVALRFKEFSTLQLSIGSWQSLQIRGEGGFNVSFFNADIFVRGTDRFLFVCPSQKAGDMCRVLRAACARQGVTCHECEHLQVQKGHPDSVSIARISNVKLCKQPGPMEYEQLIPLDGHMWPHRDLYPELYT